MIDFHCLLHPVYERTPFDFEHAQCKVYFLKGINGRIGIGRYEGFNKGNNKYVSFYDDDDLLNVGIIDEIIRRLEADETIDAICTDEQVIVNGSRRGLLKPIKDGSVLTLKQARFIHHLVVVRRSSIQPFLPILLDCPDLCELTLWGSMIKSGCKFQWLREFGYTWVKHPQNARSMRIEPSDFSKQIIREIHQ